MTDKKPIEFYQSKPEEYSITSAGSVREKGTGQIIAMFPELNPHAITTPERGRELAGLRRAHGLRSKMLGLIDAYNAKQAEADKINPDNLTEEELILAAGDAIRLLTKHMALKFSESGNLRGMGEVFGKLTEPFTEDPSERGAPPTPGTISGTPAAIRELLTILDEEIQARLNKAKAIDGEAQ